MSKTINKLVTILWASLLAGTLDILSALVLNYKISPVKIFQFIASGLYGKDAFKGGTSMVLWGGLFHYLIASFFSTLLFLLYPRLIIPAKNRFALGILYGFFIWVVMNLLVLPVTNIPKTSTRLNIVTILSGTTVLVICIGIPVALIADKYYKKHPFIEV